MIFPPEHNIINFPLLIVDVDTNPTNVLRIYNYVIMLNDKC